MIKDIVFVNQLAMKLPDIPMKTNEQRRLVAYLDSFPLSRDLRQARLASLRELQSQTQEELDALIPSVLACTAFFSDRAFKGEL